MRPGRARGAVLVAGLALLAAARPAAAAPGATSTSLALAERLRALGDPGGCTVEALRHAYEVPAEREPAFERAALCLGLAGRWPDAQRLLLGLPEPRAEATRYRLCWVEARLAGPGPACARAPEGAGRLALLATELPVLYALRTGRFDEARRALEALPPASDPTLAAWRGLDAALAARALSRPRHSPWLAGALSAVVPGLGRVYLGRWQDGLMSAVLIGVPAGFAANGFAKHGTSSVRGWILGTLSGVLYVGNVYGSAAGAVEVDAEAERRLRHEADEHHAARAAPGG